MGEQERGCGWRKVGGAYFVGSGMRVSCDALPLPLDPCGECGFQISIERHRGIQRIHLGYLIGLVKKKHKDRECIDEFPCPICSLRDVPCSDKGSFFLMWISSGAYTTSSFLKEAGEMGVSKRIPPQSIPKDFKVGESWIFLAHKETEFRTEKKEELAPLFAEPEKKAGIFYAFQPSRIEILVWKDTPYETIREWEEKGFTPVLIEKTKKNIERHGRKEEAPSTISNRKTVGRKKKK